MKTSQFEGVKVAIKQDKTGYVLTLSIHPDDIPNEILRDFVGSRYQVVMVRLNGEERPMNREHEHTRDIIQLAVLLCKNPDFHEFLAHHGSIQEKTDSAAGMWMKETLGVESRAELKTNPEAAQHLLNINEEFKAWKLQRG
jgi:hypothetical protein